MKTYLFHRTASSLVAAISVAVLTACGGGGGGDSAADSVAAISPGPSPGVVTIPAAASKAWGTARLIDADNIRPESSPMIAMDASGNALAGWIKYDGTRPNLWTSFSTPGNAGSKVVPIQTNNVDSIGVPDIKFDTNGNAMAVWNQHDGIRNDIWANRYTPGSGWGTATRIETNNIGSALSPKIAFDAKGNALAVWEQSDGTRFNIWANRYTPGSGWGAAELIESDNAGHATRAEIAMDTNGNAIAVWMQADDRNQANIWANRYTLGSGWGTASLIETNDVGGAFNPKIAIDASGNALVVWTQLNGSELFRSAKGNIWANRYTPGSGWGTAGLIKADNTGSAVAGNIAMNASGNATAVWFQLDGTRFDIWANRYTPGSGWGTPELIETDNAGDAREPEIVMDASGNALAVWRQSDGTRFNIWANRYTPGSGWSTAALLETDNAGSANRPQIAMDASGNAHALWVQSDGTKDNVWVNSYR